MTTRGKDSLFVLVKSLTKSEKRLFKVYVGRLEGNTDSKFLTLFNFLDKSEHYQEAEIIRRGIVSKRQLSNLKAHLYKQILTSLRLSPIHQDIRTFLREQMDYASILYRKGLYSQSLKVLDKAKIKALENHENIIAYQIIEFEKLIESQFITRSIASRADALSMEAKELSQKNVVASKLSNLSLQLYGLMLKTGYVKNDKEQVFLQTYFEARLPVIDWSSIGFREKLWFYKAHLWYSLMNQDFLNAYKYANKWVHLFYEYPKMIEVNPVFFLKGYNYLLEALFLVKSSKRLRKNILKLEKLVNSEGFPNQANTRALCFLYLSANTYNWYFLTGEFEKGLPVIKQTLVGIENYRGYIDNHHIMVLYYKIACLYFGSGNTEDCLKYLQKIIQNKSLKMREDLMCFARILSLVALFELERFYELELQLKQTYKFLIKMDDLYAVQREIIAFLRHLKHVDPLRIRVEFKKLYQRLKKFEDHPYEKRAFLYLDILSWLQSNIQNVPISQIIGLKNSV